jgi:hypothetical protein
MTALAPIPEIRVDVLTKTELSQLKTKALTWAREATNVKDVRDSLELVSDIKKWERFLELNPDWQ